jgi:hypothetical protein
MLGLYDSLDRSDLPEPQTGCNQPHSKQDGDPELLPREGQRRHPADSLRLAEDALRLPALARRRSHLAG